MAVRRYDPDPGQCLTRLREQGETVRWQPVSPTLVGHLASQAAERGGEERKQQLLRYRDRRPITSRPAATECALLAELAA